MIALLVRHGENCSDVVISSLSIALLAAESLLFSLNFIYLISIRR